MPPEQSTNGKSVDGQEKTVLSRLLDEIQLLLNQLKSESFMNHSQVRCEL